MKISITVDIIKSAYPLLKEATTIESVASAVRVALAEVTKLNPPNGWVTVLKKQGFESQFEVDITTSFSNEVLLRNELIQLGISIV